MHYRKLFLLTILATALLSVTRPASAGVAINIGVPPACPYGYFDYAPYNCAPYGYYGPAWFSGGIEWNGLIPGHTPFTCAPVCAWARPSSSTR